MTENIEARLEEFISKFDIEKLCLDADHNTNKSTSNTAKLLNTYLNEAKSNFYIIAPYLKKDIRILEVGSGIGIVTAFLKSEGYDILGIEPGEKGGFSFMTKMHDALLAQIPPQIQPEILSIGASDLEIDKHGSFDLIFSVNVMEHVFPLENAMEAMANVLSENGVMRHLCPNYHFPFEPHLGIPLVPFFPKATRYVLPGPIKRNQLIWDGVNFITASNVKKLSSNNGLKSEFERGVMARFFERIAQDVTFADRHQGVIATIGKMPVLGKLVRLIFQLIPATLATPMIMTLSHDRKK